jgi:hypothetical protein
MAQADYVVANGTGAAVRSDLNGQLAAIVSNNSGVTEPATMYAYQWWADTTTGLLKIRNAANNAWITVGTLADANLGLLSLAGGTLTGALLLDDSGTVSAPALAFDGDSNTGIFSPGADQFGIATNGVERVEFGTTEVVFNDGGADIDFRIEGDTKANLFKVDAGADTVIIDGLTYPSVDGTADQAVVTNGSGVLSFATRARSVQATAVASTSGTSIDFTGIPSWVTRVTVMLAGVSTNGTSSLLLQIGDSGGIENTGYTSYCVDASGELSANFSTAGFILTSTGILASMQFHGDIVITRLSGNTWVASNTLGTEATGFNVFVGAGSKTLSTVLDRVRLTTVGGANTFDAGTINIMYEG